MEVRLTLNKYRVLRRLIELSLLEPVGTASRPGLTLLQGLTMDSDAALTAWGNVVVLQCTVVGHDLSRVHQFQIIPRGDDTFVPDTTLEEGLFHSPNGPVRVGSDPVSATLVEKG